MIDNNILNQDDNNDGVGRSSSKEKIKLDDGNNKGVNDTSGNIRDINITFFRVWRNKVIRNEILFHTRLFNIHLGRSIGFTLEELSTYKYKSYLNMVLIGVYEHSKTLFPNVIPYGVSCVEFDFLFLKLRDNSIPNTVTTVRFFGSTSRKAVFGTKFTKRILPDSITHLDFGDHTSFNQSFAGGWLPNSLKSLSLPIDYERSIKVNQLPESLTELNFRPYEFYKGKIEPGSIPSTTRPLNYTWECECKELKNQESSNVPISTIEYGISDCIKEGDIPHNTISIKFSESFSGGEIQGALPASLKSFEFGYSIDVTIVENVLSSSNLTSIDMGSYNLPLISNLFPQSITSIKFRGFNKPIPEGYFYNHTNLKSLEFIEFDQVIPDKTLPPSLTSLKFGNGFNQDITENTLPPSLTLLDLGRNYRPLKTQFLPVSLLTLKLGYCQHTLNSNVLPESISTLEIRSGEYTLGIGQTLPSSITSLSLGTSHPIPVGSLPCNLKVLYIKNHYKQDLTEEGLLPESIQSFYLNRNQFYENYINNLDVDFFKKYIRFQ